MLLFTVLDVIDCFRLHRDVVFAHSATFLLHVFSLSFSSAVRCDGVEENFLREKLNNVLRHPPCEHFHSFCGVRTTSPRFTRSLSRSLVFKVLVKRDMLRENAILHVLADTRTKSYDVLLPTFTSTLERDCNPIDSLNSL
jgi:hypothetical protein